MYLLSFTLKSIKQTNEQTDRTQGRTERRKDGRGRTNRQTDGRTDGRTDAILINFLGINLVLDFWCWSPSAPPFIFVPLSPSLAAALGPLSLF